MVDGDVSRKAKRAWLSRVFGISIPLESEAGTPPDGIDPAELRGRLNEIGLRVRELRAAPGAAEIKQRFVEAVQALKAGDLERDEFRLVHIRRWRSSLSIPGR